MINMIMQSGTTENFAFVIRKDSKGVFYVIGICLLKQTVSGAQSVTSPSKIEGLKALEADLSALLIYIINHKKEGRYYEWNLNDGNSYRSARWSISSVWPLSPEQMGH